MSNRGIQETIRKLAGTHLKDDIYLIQATVTSVNIPERTCDCTPIGGEAVTDLTGVQLMAEIDDGFLLIPAINSTVIVCYSTRNVPYIALFSAIDAVLLVTLTGIKLQGDELGGLVITPHLLTKINNIENAFNLLNTKVNSISPTPVIPNLIPTTLGEIENTAVKQGGI